MDPCSHSPLFDCHPRPSYEKEQNHEAQKRSQSMCLLTVLLNKSEKEFVVKPHQHGYKFGICCGNANKNANL